MRRVVSYNCGIFFKDDSVYIILENGTQKAVSGAGMVKLLNFLDKGLHTR